MNEKVSISERGGEDRFGDPLLRSCRKKRMRLPTPISIRLEGRAFHIFLRGGESLSSLAMRGEKGKKRKEVSIDKLRIFWH